LTLDTPLPPPYEWLFKAITLIIEVTLFWAYYEIKGSFFYDSFLRSGQMNKHIAMVMTLASLLFGLFPKAYGYGVEVPFIGNSMVDIEVACFYGGSDFRIPFDNVIVVRDGVEIAHSNGDNIGEFGINYLYRDTGLTNGDTPTYSYCCEPTSTDEYSKFCGGGETVVVGEVGGTVKQDLNIINEELILYKDIKVAEGAVLFISDSNIESFQNKLYRIGSRFNAWVQGEMIPEGDMQFQGNTISEKVSINFDSSGNNFLSDNTLKGGSVHIKEGAQVKVISNDLNDVDFSIAGDTFISFLDNSFFNSTIAINHTVDSAEVFIQGNDFVRDINRIIFAASGKMTIINNTFRGQSRTLSSGKQGNTTATAIYAGSGESDKPPVNLTITSNTFKELNYAVEIRDHVDGVISGNVFDSNRVAISSRDNVNLSVTGNTISNNISQGIWFNFDNNPPSPRQTVKTITNNCFSGNEFLALNNQSESTDINAANNWWGDLSGPFHEQENSSGKGNEIQGSGIDFSPWLSASNCQSVPTPPEAQPATVSMTASPSELPADGQSSTTLTISLKDENQSPISNAQVLLATPEFGVLSQQTGSTDASGQLQVLYTAPIAQVLNGQDSIELTVEYPTDSITDSTFINFTAATVSIWADPHISAETTEVAVIPGDSRFPGRYQFTLRDPAGQILPGETLIVSIADSNRARLESDNGQSGRKITIMTDAKGHAVVDYVYLGSPAFTAPFEDIITIAHDAMLETVTAKVSVGLDINIKMLTPAQRDTGVFPLTLGMRIELEDSFRPEVDLRAYFSELEKISEINVGMDVSVEWLDRPAPEFMDQFQAIFPNLGNDDPPELYDGLAAVNYGNHNLTEVITEALDTPNITFANNTFPAITFTDPGNFWFIAYAEPIILPEGAATDYEYIKGARRDPDTGIIFGATIMPEVESVFQSVVCSVNPTGPGQFMAMTLLIDNPYFQILPPSVAVNMMVKFSSSICDFMKGNYVTAAGKIASLRVDGLNAAYGSGDEALNLLGVNFEQYQRLQKLIKVNDAYSKIDNFSSYVKDYAAPALLKKVNADKRKAPKKSRLLDAQTLPEGLSATEYEAVLIKSMSGEMSAYADLIGWQTIGIINKETVSLSNTPEGTEQFSYNDVHIFLLPSEASTLLIESSEATRIFRFYLASERETFNLDYTFTASNGLSSLLSLGLMELDLNIDTGADGTIDYISSPTINQVDTTRTVLDLSTNQSQYQPGDTFELNVSLNNPGESIEADIHFSVKNDSGLLFSIPDITPGYTPVAKNVVIPAGLEIPKTTIFTFPVTEVFRNAGPFTLETFLTYPGNMKVIGDSFDSVLIDFR